jgi:very-short-patch-repair endonuclease
MSDFKKHRAAEMRGAMTDAERKLWRALRAIVLGGTHFRRQVVIGPYIADFVCLAARLIIEVDGSQHNSPDQRCHDDRRTTYLEAQGFRVLRFWNAEVLRETSAVVDTIHAAVFEGRDPEQAIAHTRRRMDPTPARAASRPSPCRGG